MGQALTMGNPVNGALEIERRCVAALLTWGEKEMPFVPPAHVFGDAFLATVVKHAHELHGEKAEVSALSLHARMGGGAGVLERLFDVQNAYDNTSTVLALRDALFQRYRQRTMHRIGATIARAGDQPITSIADIEALAKQLEELKDPSTAPATPASKVRKLAPPDIDAICKAQPGKHLRIPTLCPPLDRYTGGGLQTGRFITIGGAPGVRKTSYALAMAHAIASAESPRALCVFIAGDEPRDGLLSRIGQMAGMSRSALDDEDLANSVPSWDFVAQHMKTVPNLVLFDPTADHVTVEEVAEWAGAEARRTNARLVLIVDSLQTAPFSCDSTGDGGREKSVREKVNDRVKMLKRIKEHERACVIVISELNREGYRTGQKADLSSFKESSDIEYGADVAMAIVGIKSEDGVDKNLVEVTLLKNRLGPNDVAFKLRRTARCTFETEEQLEAEMENVRSIKAEREAKEAAEFERRTKACAERLLKALVSLKGQVRTRDDLQALVKEQRRVVQRAVSQLLADDRIRKDKNGCYRVASAVPTTPHLTVLEGGGGMVEGGSAEGATPTADEPPHTDNDMPLGEEKVGGDDLDF